MKARHVVLGREMEGMEDKKEVEKVEGEGKESKAF